MKSVTYLVSRRPASDITDFARRAQKGKRYLLLASYRERERGWGEGEPYVSHLAESQEKAEETQRHQGKGLMPSTDRVCRSMYRSMSLEPAVRQVIYTPISPAWRTCDSVYSLKRAPGRHGWV